MSVHRHPGRVPDELELVAYADGRLDGDSARGREIAAWLDSQPAARRRVHDYVQQDREIRAQFASCFAAPLPPRLDLAAIRRRQRRRLRGFGAAAAALLVAVAAAWLLPERGRDADLERFAQDVVLQLERDPAELRTPAANARPAFIPEDFTATGMRELHAASGPLTEYVYHDADGRSLLLFVSGEPQAADGALHWRHAGDRSIVYWQSDGRRYALSGEIHAPELQLLALQALQQPAIETPLSDDAATLAVAEPSIVAPQVEAQTLIMPPDGGTTIDGAPLIGVDMLQPVDAMSSTEQPLL
jgi:anti-sigma factor RsiW